MRNWITWLLPVSIMFVLAACSVPEPAVPSESAGSEREDLVLWSYYETEEQRDALEQLITGFNLAQEEYLAQWKYVNLIDFTKQISIGVAENELPDLVIIDNPNMPKYIQMGVFEDISENIRRWENLDDYYPQVLQSVTYEERFYGIPYCCNNVALIYNKDLLAAKGVTPPANWEEFVAAAELLTDDNCYGFGMSAINGEQGVFQLLPWILSAGTRMNGLGDEHTERVYTMLGNLLSQGYMSSDCINWSQNDLARKFVSGECAMIENGPWVLPYLQKHDINYGIATLPYDQESITVIGGENLAVIKGKNITGSLKFIEYYSQDHVMEQICKTSSVLAPKKKLAEKQAAEVPDFAIFCEQIPNSISRTSFDNWTLIQETLDQSLYHLFIEAMPPAEVAREIRTKMQQ